MTNEEFLEEAKDVIDYLLEIKGKHDTWREYTNIDTRKNYGIPMVDDLGDSIPFIAWYGKLTGAKRLVDMADFLAKRLLERYQREDGTLITEKKNVYDADKMSDSILGINLMARLADTPYFVERSKSFFSGLNKHMVTADGLVIYKKSYGIKIPFSSGKFSGLYAEESINLYDISGDREALFQSERYLRPWIDDPYFNNNGLFPFKSSSRWNQPLMDLALRIKYGIPLLSAMSSKANSNLIFALTSYYEKTKDKEVLDVLMKWKEGVKDKMISKNGLFYVLWTDHGRYNNLALDHAMIDCFLEINRVTGDKESLSVAEGVAGCWLKHQDKTGLMPQGIETEEIHFLPEEKKYAYNFSRLDTQTDFGVVLVKLYFLTKNEDYLLAAERIGKAVIRHHRKNRGYAGFVKIDSLKKYDITIETKFLFLLNKLFLALAFAKEEDFFRDKLNMSMMRDR